MDIFIILPDQLFYTTYALQCLQLVDTIYIVEDTIFFNGMCKSKIVLHRASMKYYKDLLTKYFSKHNITIKYINVKKINTSNIDEKTPALKSAIKIQKPQTFIEYFKDIKQRVNMFYPASIHAYKDIRTQRFHGINIKFYDTPAFYLRFIHIRHNYEHSKAYNETAFYKYMRKLFTPALNPKRNGRFYPVGGEWTYDDSIASYKTFEKDMDLIPKSFEYSANTYFDKATTYPNKVSNVANSLVARYPVTHLEAMNLLLHFLQYKLENFGLYPEIICKQHNEVFHSLLSSSLNIGLLTPIQVVEETIEFCNKKSIHINIFEPFLHQILGWREYMRLMYTINSSYKEKNYLGHIRELSDKFYTGNTTFEPIDACIKQVLATGYLHHNQRLMIMGNFFMLQQINPQHVYKWFMTLFIDSYDWVTVPNVFGLSQFADGGNIATQPYISTSRDILKISNYSGGDWVDKWDALFWLLVNKHKKIFKKMYIASTWVKTIENMPLITKTKLLNSAPEYLI